MIEEPDFDEGAGVGIGQIFFSTLLEIVSGDLVRVIDDSVDHFEAVAIRLMFKVAADSVEDGRGKEHEQGNYKYQDRQRSPVFHITNTPGRAPAGQHPAREPVGEVHEKKNQHGIDGNFFGDVEQDVVAHFVSENEERFGDGGFGDRVVPNDDALRCAESGDVSVEAGSL